MRYCDNTFPMSFASTIGVDIKIKMINIKGAICHSYFALLHRRVGQKVKLQIWDTAGQERFKTLTSNVYRGVHGLMLVYDVSDEFSFANVRKWMMHLDKHTDSKTVRILIGNKVDSENRVLGHRRTPLRSFSLVHCCVHQKISIEQGQELAAEFGLKFFETSGKEDINVTPAFEWLSNDIIESKKAEFGSAPEQTKVSLGEEASTKAPCAC